MDFHLLLSTFLAKTNMLLNLNLLNRHEMIVMLSQIQNQVKNKLIKMYLLRVDKFLLFPISLLLL
jgi:hypothetical protein